MDKHWIFYSVLALLLQMLFPMSHAWLMDTFPDPSRSFQRSAVLRDDQYRLLWQVDGNNLTVEVQVRTTGWVGFGLSPNGAMPGSDIVIGGVRDGKPYFTDRHALSSSTPVVDSSQDYNLLAATEADGFTTLTFLRDLLTCDEDDMPIQDGSTRVVFAWGDADLTDGASPAGHDGTNRGSRTLLLLDEPVPAPSPAGTHSYNITMNQYTIPGNDRTTYACRIVRAPNFTEKHQVISVAPILQKGNELFVHHLIVWPCYGTLAMEEHVNCYYPLQGVTCSDALLFIWAVGNDDEFVFPDNVGVPIGGAGDPDAYLIQIHYDNPSMTSGVVDSSGLQLVYTADVRPHNAAILVLGYSLTGEEPLIVPPGAPAFRTTAHCSSSCTAANVPETGLTVFAVAPHTHLVGKSVITQHVRKGTELPELARDDHYDFNMQSWRTLRNSSVTILPGDEFITTCVYDTKDKQSVTYGGEGTDDEMCLTFVYYYPAMDWGSCVSWNQNPYTVYRFLKNKHDEGLMSLPNLTPDNAITQVNAITWTPEYVAEFQSLSLEAPYYAEYCVASNVPLGLFGFTGDHTFRRPVRVEKKLVKEDSCAETTTGTPSMTDTPTKKTDTSPSPRTTPDLGVVAMASLALLITFTNLS